MGAAASAQSNHKASHKAPSEKSDSVKKNEPTFGVELMNVITLIDILPPKFLLRISYESLDFIDITSKIPYVQFPYQTILCWGSTEYSFTFKVDVDRNFQSKNGEFGKISLKTSHGKAIETATMSTVRRYSCL